MLNMKVLCIRSHEEQTIANRCLICHISLFLRRERILQLDLQYDALTGIVDDKYASVDLPCKDHTSLAARCQLVDVCDGFR